MEWWVGATCPKTLSDPWQLYIAITVCCRPYQMFKICLLNQGWFGVKSDWWWWQIYILHTTLIKGYNYYIVLRDIS